MTENHHDRLLNGLGVVAAVVDAGNFVRAAETLGLTQSGVSRAIARLEQRLGVRLFDRTPRAVALTDEGLRFYERVAPLLADIEDAAADAAGSSAAVRGRLRVMIDPLVSRLILAPRLAGFLAAHPELSVDVSARDRLGDLVSEGFDVAVRFGEPEPSALVARRLRDIRVLTCASRSYLAKRGKPKHPSDLAGHECIQFRDPATGRPFAWEFHRNGKVLPVPVQGRLTVNDVATMLRVCADGHGIAQILEMSHDRSLVELFPDWNEERFPLYVFYPSRRLPPAKVRVFVDFIVASTR
jgi:DNA-binding transcriptional LysR family regulator